LYPNIRHVLLRSDGRVALDLIPHIHERSGTPVRNGANHLWLDAIARQAGSGVLLVGTRGNFSVSYTGVGCFAEMMRQWHWKAALDWALQARQTEGKPLWKTLMGGLLPRTLAASLRQRLYGESAEFLSLTTRSFEKNIGKRCSVNESYRVRAQPLC